MNIGGNCRVGAGAFLGIGSTVSNGVDIASGVVLGAGAVALSNLAESGVYVGVPARMIRGTGDWLARI